MYDYQLNEVQWKSGGFYVQVVLLSQSTGSISCGNLSTFDIIGSTNPWGTVGNNVVTTESKESWQSISTL